MIEKGLPPIRRRQNYNLLLAGVAAARPGETEDPSDDRPPEKEVDDKYGAGAVVLAVVGNDGG